MIEAFATSSLRRRIFAECPRVAVIARPGEAYAIHRLALHGVAPWQEEAPAGPDGRMIAYFRPALERALADGGPYVISVEVPTDSEVSPWAFIHPAKPS